MAVAENTGKPAVAQPRTSGDRQYGDGVSKAAVAATPNAPRPNVVPPGAFGPLTAPTSRPDEPVTAGLPIGPGPGPDSLGMGAAPADDSLWELRALAARMANPPRDLLRIIALAESEL